MYKSIQPLDYFSTELTTYIGTLSHLAKWPALVRVNQFYPNILICLLFFDRLCFDYLIRKLYQIVLHEIL